MSFDRQTEKAAEDLSDPFDAMIRMCGFVFENLRSDKLPGRIGFFWPDNLLQNRVSQP